MASIVVRGLLTASRPLETHERGWLADAETWTRSTLQNRGSYVFGPLATFSRPLIDEELPTLTGLDAWSLDMDLLPGRGTVELSTAPRLPRNLLTAPKLARHHERMRRGGG